MQSKLAVVLVSEHLAQQLNISYLLSQYIYTSTYNYNISMFLAILHNTMSVAFAFSSHIQHVHLNLDQMQSTNIKCFVYFLQKNKTTAKTTTIPKTATSLQSFSAKPPAEVGNRKYKPQSKITFPFNSANY